MMRPENEQPKVTLEQLLRVKRAEQPEPEFWTQFERELRTKQLAAIVEPRPWWAPLIRIGSRLARYQVPIGATAVVALTLLTVRQFELKQPEFVAPAAAPQLAENAPEAFTALAPVDAAVLAQLDSAAAESPFVSSAEASPAVDSLAALAAEQPLPLLAEAAVAKPELASEATLNESLLLLDEGAAAQSIEPSLAARILAANFEALQASDPELAQIAFPELTLLSRSGAFASAGDELLESVAPGAADTAQPRSSRLLASALPVSATVLASSVSSGLRSSLRLNRSISEERLYDLMRRGGSSLEGVPMRF